MNLDILVQVLATLAWLVVVSVVVIVVITTVRRRDRRNTGPSLALVIVIGLVAIILSFFSAGLVFIQPHERGVVISATAPQGYREQTLQSGLHWILPLAETTVTYPIVKQTYTMTNEDAIEARTKDGQEIFIDSSVIFSIDPEQIIELHIKWQDRYRDELVRPLMRGIIRDAVSQYRVEEVVSTRRTQLSSRIREETAHRLSGNGLTFEDFVLRDIAFSPEYNTAIEQKQIAQQEAEKAKLVVDQRKQEAEQTRQIARGEADAAVIRAEAEAQARLIQAEAEAKALELVADILAQNPNLMTYEYVHKLSPGIQVMLVPNNAPYLLPPLPAPAPGEQPANLAEPAVLTNPTVLTQTADISP